MALPHPNTGWMGNSDQLSPDTGWMSSTDRLPPDTDWMGSTDRLSPDTDWMGSTDRLSQDTDWGWMEHIDWQSLDIDWMDIYESIAEYISLDDIPRVSLSELSDDALEYIKEQVSIMAASGGTPQLSASFNIATGVFSISGINIPTTFLTQVFMTQTNGTMAAALSIVWPDSQGRFTSTGRWNNPSFGNYILNTAVAFSMSQPWQMTPPTITTPSRYYGRVGQGLSRLTGSQGSGFAPAPTWSLVSGTLPPGVTGINPDGSFAGTPTTAGTWTITVRHGDANPAGGPYNVNFHVDRSVTIVIAPGTGGTTPQPTPTPIPTTPTPPPQGQGVVATYVYRADGLRHSKTVNGVITTHVWDGAHIVAERNANGGVMNRFDRGAGQRIIRSEHHGWYLHNVRGDVIQRTNASGSVVHLYRYTAFGVEFNNNAGNTNPWRFAGEYWDAERGEYYLRARSFNPRTGRFTQPDPFWNTRNMQRSRSAIAQSSNLFVYTMNNPVRFIDPSGMVAMLPGNVGAAGLNPSSNAIQNAMNQAQAAAAAAKNAAIAAAATVAATRATNQASSSVTSGGIGSSNAVPVSPEIKLKLVEWVLALVGVAAAATYNAVSSTINITFPSIPVTGPASGININSPGGVLGTAMVGGLATLAAPSAGVLSQQQILDMAMALAAVDANRLDEYRFFEATLIGDEIVIGRAMTINEAKAHIGNIPRLSSTQGVFAVTSGDAFALTMEFGGIASHKGPFDHTQNRSGYFLHFHPRTRPNAHIWFIG